MTEKDRQSAPVSIEVWGSHACFSRPETKTERLTYPVMTPSAARGVFDAIYWKPGLWWQVERIEVLSPIRLVSLRRNEVKSVISERNARRWMEGQEVDPLFSEEDRTQRQTMALANPRYRVTAHMVALEGSTRGIEAMMPQFLRRVQMGQCYHQPFLGCKEFAAFFRLIQTEDDRIPPIPLDLPIGPMLYDMFSPIPGVGKLVFNATMLGGVLEVPPVNAVIRNSA